MGFIGYLKFKMGSWVEVETLPDWVFDANEGYYQGFIDKYGHRPYDEDKVYSGDPLEYKIYYETIGQGKIRDRYYARVKR